MGRGRPKGRYSLIRIPPAPRVAKFDLTTTPSTASEAVIPNYPTGTFASDIDGDRWAIVDPASADMAGWKTRYVDPYGKICEDQFMLQGLASYATAGQGHFWIASAEHGMSHFRLVSPTGDEQEVDWFQQH